MYIIPKGKFIISSGDNFGLARLNHQSYKMCIDKKEFDTIKELIISSIDPAEIYIFGSYANRAPDKNSDIDICVVKEGLKSIKDELKYCALIREKLEYLQTAMDILIFEKKTFIKRKNIFGSIQYDIFNNGIRLYERRKKTAVK